jgi:hypothetical protein
VYHTWTFASNAPTGYSSYLLPGGVVLRSVTKSGNYFTGGPICGQVQKVDWNGNVIWNYVYSTTAYCSHHDIHPMPNGNVLLIAYESKTPAEVTAAGCSQSITMWPDKIVEIQPVGTDGGNVVWEWKVWDHLCQSFNPAKSNYVTSIVQHPELLNVNYNTQKDWMHVNGVDYNEALDQIVFSSHNLNEFYVIDHSTTTAEAAGHTGGNAGKGGDFLYRWGNPTAYQAAGTTNFNVVHNAHWVPADCPHAGYLCGFNNKGGAGQKNCIDLINPPINGYNYNITLGNAFQPSTYNWRHTYSGTPTQNEGHSQQLPNGNMLITISLQGYVYEIDSNQTVVWSKTISGGTTNARRYTACYVNGPLSVTTTASSNQGCAGNSVQLNATASGGSTYTYAWTSLFYQYHNRRQPSCRQCNHRGDRGKQHQMGGYLLRGGGIRQQRQMGHHLQDSPGVIQQLCLGYCHGFQGDHVVWIVRYLYTGSRSYVVEFDGIKILFCGGWIAERDAAAYRNRSAQPGVDRHQRGGIPAERHQRRHRSGQSPSCDALAQSGHQRISSRRTEGGWHPLHPVCGWKGGDENLR